MKLLKVPDVMEILGLGRTQVYALKSKIGYVQIGGAIRFRREDVDRYIAERVVRDVPQRRKLMVEMAHIH